MNGKILTWLSMLPRNGKLKHFYAFKYENLEKLWNKDLEELEFLKDVNRKFYNAIFDETIRKNAERAFEVAVNSGIEVISIMSELYPPLLKETADAPAVLFYKGDIVRCINCISVIGSRKATAYGLKAAEDISAELSRKGACIVSGLARGIDSKAHKAAIKANGSTCAIIGCGIDVVYPPENEMLYREISANGVIISEYAPGIPPLPQNFPARNRIISGISQGIVVIEAGKESGTLITVDFALEQGRDVFAVPGNIYSLKSIGTNNLIKEGAKMVMDAEDIAEEYDFLKSKSKISGLREYIIESLESGFFEREEIERITGINTKEINIELMEMMLEGILGKCENGEYFLLKK